jgi:hypothetical protein
MAVSSQGKRQKTVDPIYYRNRCAGRWGGRMYIKQNRNRHRKSFGKTLRKLPIAPDPI